MTLENLAKINSKESIVLSEYLKEHQGEILELLNEAYNYDQVLYLLYNLLSSSDKTADEKVKLALSLLEQERPGVTERRKRNSESA